MKYFLHDCNAFDDEKISELFINFGYEGLGLFYTILEKIGKQEKPIKTVILKSQLKVGKRLGKCWQFMEEIGIINSSNEETFNERILSYSKTYQIKKEKTRKKVSEWRESQSVTENVTSYKEECNSPKVNKSKVNKEYKESWHKRKLEFLNNGIWKEQFCIARRVSLSRLEEKQRDFLESIELKKEVVDNLYQYFTNVFDKKNNFYNEGAKKQVVI